MKTELFQQWWVELKEWIKLSSFHKVVKLEIINFLKIMIKPILYHQSPNSFPQLTKRTHLIYYSSMIVFLSENCTQSIGNLD